MTSDITMIIDKKIWMRYETIFSYIFLIPQYLFKSISFIWLFFNLYTQICFKHKIIILLNKISDLKFLKEWVWIEINRKIK